MPRAPKALLIAVLCFPALIGLAAGAEAEPAAATVTADFATQDGVGHPGVFGSAINTLDDPDRIDALQQAGSRAVRRDAYLGQILPETTVEDYEANVGGVADPENWDWSRYGWVEEFHKRGYDVTLIMSYTTTWLSYGCGGTCPFWGPTPPRDYEVYGDIVRKVYQHFRGKVDRVEIWNEPDLSIFMDTRGSPYPETDAGRLAAYLDVYRTAAAAIRSVDKEIPIGGPVVSHPSRTDWANALLHADGIPASSVDFLSYHHYDTEASGEAVGVWKRLAADAGKGEDFPVYVTEWNHSPAFPPTPKSSYDPDSISYTGRRLTDFYRQHANAAHWYADNDDEAQDRGLFLGNYANGTLVPKARTYRLLSEDLGLGLGDATLRRVSTTGPVTIAGAATTSTGDDVVWVVNDGAEPLDVSVNLSGLRGHGTRFANVFEASANASVASPKSVVPVRVAGGRATVRFAAPAKSVLGVRLASYRIADSANLAPAATVTASSARSGHPATAVTDGVIAAAGDWVPSAEPAPWVGLRWSGRRTVGRVTLYDRASPGDQVLSGVLTFGDGSTVPVPALPADGTGKAVTFSPRDVSSVRFTITSSSGPEAGLAELQVDEGVNLAPQGTVTSSSQHDSTTYSRANAIDGITRRGGEWASSERKPWVRVSWVNVGEVSAVVLHDRVDGTSNVNGGVLRFSDGSSIRVTGVPRDGAPKVVRFGGKHVRWVRFEATDGSGRDVGLSELRVLGAGNLASSATVTASSAFSAPKFAGTAATDGVVNEWGGGEWASAGETTPWIQLTWPAAQVVDRVVLYDRNNPDDAVTSGTLTFSDGSSIEVDGIPNDGTGKVVAFAPRPVEWVRFDATGGAGLNVGLSEIEAFGVAP